MIAKHHLYTNLLVALLELCKSKVVVAGSICSKTEGTHSRLCCVLEYAAFVMSSSAKAEEAGFTRFERTPSALARRVS